MWSFGRHSSNKKDNIQQLAYRQGYFDKTGYYDNRSFDDEAQAPQTGYIDGHRGEAVGRYRNSSSSIQRRSSRDSENCRCSLKTVTVFVCIAIFLLIIVGVVVAVVLGAFDNKESADSPEKDVRQVTLTVDVILIASRWSPDLEIKNSDLYKATEDVFIANMDELFRNDSTTKDIYSYTVVKEFRPGSIRVIFEIVLNVQVESTDTELIQIIKTVLKSSKKIKQDSILVYVGVGRTTTISTSSSNLTTRIITTPTETPEALSTTSITNTTFQTTPGQTTTISTSSSELTNQTTVTSSTSPPGTCRVDEFRCVSDGTCIQGDWKCDDWDDCDDASDEEGCGCSDEQFRCTDGTCIPLSQKCDGEPHCEDFIDEEDCKSRDVECDEEEEFKCIKYEECVNISKVCDGINNCRDKSDEWLLCNTTDTSWEPVDLEVRLIDEGKESVQRGRVEVRILGTDDDFGTICGDHWSIEEAMVVCKMINSSFSGNIYAYKTAVFGEGTGSILMSRVRCLGNESNIGHCRSNGFGYGRVHCSHSQDASVSCDGVKVEKNPAPTAVSPDVRLVNGDTCMEGLLQVRYNDEWRFVCDDYFDNRDVAVACRMLGYNAGLGYVDDRFGIGDGVFWLDQVECQGDETHIANCSSNSWGVHDCAYYEAVGIVCGGEPSIDCAEKEECTPNVTCTFDSGDCCYQFLDPDNTRHGSTPWVRHTASQIGQVDHTQSRGQGILVYYRNIFGNANDFAFLKLPNVKQLEVPQKLEFYYLIISPGKDALTLELETKDLEVLWESRVLTPEMDGLWTYGCWDVNLASFANEVKIQFVARRGPTDNRVVALDDVKLSRGHCPDISNSKCDFDDFAKCNARIRCDNCEKDYRWHWTNNSDPFTKNGQTFNETGYHVLADSSYGTAGNVAKIDFHLSLNSSSKRGLTFRYFQMSIDDFKDRLKVSFTAKSKSSYIWKSKSIAEGDIWNNACVNLPDIDGTVIVTFEAARGSYRFGDIFIDDVNMIEFCKHPATCDFETDACGYEVNADKGNIYTWDHSKNAGQYNMEKESDIRLVGGKTPYEGRIEVLYNGEWGTVCDDGFDENAAMVICKELGYGFTEVRAFTEAYFGEGEGYIWIDEIDCIGTEDSIRECSFNPWGDEDCSHSEDAGVKCGAPSDTSLQMSGNYIRVFDTNAPYGTWTQLLSPRFDMIGVPYKLSFQMSKTGTAVLQVYLIEEENTKYDLDMSKSVYKENTDAVETVCIDVNNFVIENTRLVFESSKGRLLDIPGSDRDINIVSIDNIDISTGHCADMYACTFEQDYRLCNFQIIDYFDDNNSCESTYTWKRRGGINDLHGMEDHTAGDITGHFMSVMAIHEHYSTPADILFKFGKLNVSNSMTFRMFYKILKETSDSADLQFEAGNAKANIGISGTTLNSWIPFCAEVTAGEDSSMSALIRAINVSVAIDDVSLIKGDCPDLSANCSFDDDLLCGYSTGSGWKYIIEIDEITNNTAGFVRGVVSDSELVSPPIKVIDGSTICISASVRTSRDLQVDKATRFHLVLREFGKRTEILLRHDSLPVIGAEWQTLKYQVSKVTGEYNIAWKVTLSEEEYLDIQTISITNGDCETLSCIGDQFVCERDDHAFCLPLQQVCHNIDICPNAAKTVCRPTASCDFADTYACGWTLYGAAVMNDDKNSGLSLFLGGDRFTYAETPTFEVIHTSCLTFTLLRDSNIHLFRLLLNNNNSLEELHNFHMFKSQGRVQTVQVQLPVGSYSLGFECQQINDERTYIVVDDVSILSGTCDQNVCDGYKCNKNVDDVSKVTVCFHTEDISCDKFNDCPYGTDENECDYSVKCDFSLSTCGYEISIGFSLIELPYNIDGTNVTIATSTGTENDKALFYNAMMFDRVNFTTGPIDVPNDTCAMTMDIWIHKAQPLGFGDAFLFITANFEDEAYQTKTFTRNINLNITDSWFPFSISLHGSSVEHTDWTLGSLTIGRYLPSFSFVSYGVYVAIDNIDILSCNEPDKADVLPPDFYEHFNTSTNLPETFPNIAIDNDYVVSDSLDTVSLVCRVENLGSNHVTMHWYKGDVQVSRNDEIINQHVTTVFDLEMLKYTVTFENDATSQSLKYRLEINRVSEEDTGTYSCKVERDGLSDVGKIYVSVNTQLTFTGNNCYKNTLSTCHGLGFETVVPEGPLGFREIAYAARGVQEIEHSSTFEKMTRSCQRSVMELQCGLYLPKCHDGNPLHVCREHCESILVGCHVNDLDRDLATRLQHGCKFLPFVNESAQCLPIVVGCGMNYTEPTGTIISLNYPDPYLPNNKCDWTISVDLYHIIEFEVISYNVGKSTGSSSDCGLLMKDNTNKSFAFNCGEDVPSKFLSNGNMATLTFQSDSVSSGNGFYIKYSQIPIDTCTSISVENKVHLSSSINRFDESCNKIKIYLQDSRESLEVTIDYLADGCITLFNNMQLNVSICDINKKHHYLVRGYVDIHFLSPSAVYEINTYKIPYVRSVEEVTIDNSGRIQILSEGELGTICGDIDQSTADLICKSLKNGWPATIEKGTTLPEILPRIVSDILCKGFEKHITQCRFVFNLLETETCTDSVYTRQIVTCPQTVISCDFTKSTCGYILDSHVNFSPIYGLHHIVPGIFSKSVARSTPFYFPAGVYLHVEYIIRRGATDAGITINLVQLYSNTSVTLWNWQSFTTYGIFKGCAEVPTINTNGDELYQLVIEYTAGEIQFNDPSNEYTGLKSLTLSFDKCIDDTKTLECSFENIDNCASFINVDHISCPGRLYSNGSVTVASKSSYSPAEWIQTDHSYRNKTGHYLLVDEGTSLPFITLAKVSSGLNFLRFYFGTSNGVDSMKNAMLTLYADDKIIYESTATGSDWTEVCIDISNLRNATMITLDFADKQLGNMARKTASLAIDDVSVTSVPCAYHLNCDFESDCSVIYDSVINDEVQHLWVLKKALDDTNVIPHFDATYKTVNKGSYMKADIDGAQEGAVAILKSRDIHEKDYIKCISFLYYIHGNRNPGSLIVMLNTGNSSFDSFEVPGAEFEEEWHIFKVSVKNNVRFIQFEAIKGIGDGTVAIDDVTFSSESCNVGLDKLDYCTFEDPEQCGIDQVSEGWKKGSAKNLKQYIPFDADLNLNGYVYYTTPHLMFNKTESLVRFDVKTNKTAFQFSYISTGETAAKIFTVLNDQTKYIDNQIVNAWVISECLSVPGEYDGEIKVGIEHERNGVRFLAIDNVRLLNREDCEESTLTCNFALRKKCNFKSENNSWTFSESFTTTRSGLLHAPIVIATNDKKHCFAFIYKILAVNTVDMPPNLILYKNTEEIWRSQGNVGLSTRTLGQVTLDDGILDLRFASVGRGHFELYETKLTSGACENIAGCTEFLCSDKCLPNERKCDRKVDCLFGEDENEDFCGFEFNLDFSKVTILSSTGFETPVSSNNEWKLLSNSTLIVHGSEIVIPEQVLVTYFTRVNIKPSILESFEYHVGENSCLQIDYISDAAFGKIELNFQTDDEKQTETVFEIEPSISTQHISVPVKSGNVRVVLSVYMIKLLPVYSNDIRSSATFAVKQIIMHAGKLCQELIVECPDDIPNMCSDKRSCYTDEQKCDLAPNCYDNSDEIDDCGYGIVCDFEHKNLCGYTNNTVAKTYWDDRSVIEMTQSLWERTASMLITRPPTDHTFQISGKGHFMTSKNHEGLLDEIRYVDVETMTSPFQKFDEDGCVTFWYYLNSTGHQPKSTSAQIFVYLQYNDTFEKKLLWFDHINRPFPTWNQGGISVDGNRSVRLIVTAKTSIPFDAYTGVVSFDDVEYSQGECIVPILDCDEDMFQCLEDKVCIPDSMVCDGGPDCLDGSDEQHCDRPDGAIQLVGGDGTYGKLAFFYNGAWRPVCYPTTDFEQLLFKLHAAHYVCEQLQFRGNSDAFSYRLWEKHSPTQIKLSCDGDGSCSTRATVNECDMYAYIRCSNDVCFSGEGLCPGTRATCVPELFFCDGQQDCPENMDEKQCFCFEGEDKCLHTPDECEAFSCESCEDRNMFECQDHQCIPLENRCDGVKQCYDGTDEYRCVQIDKDFTVTIFLASTLTREIICGEDVSLDDAETFCRIAGQGYVSEIGMGTTQIKSGITAKDFDEKLNCFPLKLQCHFPECGTTVIQDNMIQPYIIGGRDSSVEEWPWYGALLMGEFFLCGVSLIHPSWALTVSHCINEYEGRKFRVAFGMSNYGSGGEFYQEINVVQTYGYGYVPSDYPAHDIALLKLEHPVIINNGTRPLCLPTMTSLDDVISRWSQAECYVVGLGFTEQYFSDPSVDGESPDVLQERRVQIVSYEYCKQIWLSETEGDGTFPIDVVCVAAEGPSSPTCLGDSGSPLMCRADNGRWELIGAASFGYGNCFHDVIPSVMTSVSKYNEWIRDITGME